MAISRADANTGREQIKFLIRDYGSLAETLLLDCDVRRHVFDTPAIAPNRRSVYKLTVCGLENLYYKLPADRRTSYENSSN